MGSVTIKPDGSIDVKGMQISVDASATMTLKATGVMKIQAPQVMIG